MFLASFAPSLSSSAKLSSLSSSSSSSSSESDSESTEPDAHRHSEADIINAYPPTPIFMLNEDILWRIFCISADEDEMEDGYGFNQNFSNGHTVGGALSWAGGGPGPGGGAVGGISGAGGVKTTRAIGALNVIRHISQACGTWRRILLDAPSIWANIINVNYLLQKDGKWREEVLRRTGKAPMSVRGTVDGRYGPARELFSTLLKENWDRIRRLNVRIRNRDAINGRTWEIFQRPAQRLESFVVTFYLAVGQLSFGEQEMEGEGKSDQPLMLFGDRAGALKEFNCTQVRFSLRASWLGHLRSVTLSAPFTVEDVLDGLPNMPLLESLDLRQDIVPSQSGVSLAAQPIRLEFLSKIVILNKRRTCLTFLDHIIPAPGCTLDVRTTDRVQADQIPSPNDPERELLHRVLYRYTANYFNFQPDVKTLTIKGIKNVFAVYVQYRENDLSHFRFRFEIYDNFQRIPNATYNFLRVFAACQFDHITDLVLLNDPTSELLHDDPNLVQFLAAFPSVESLQASTHALEFCLGVRTTPILFPALQSLKIRTALQVAELSETICAFYERRQEERYPVRKLDLSGHFIQPLDLSFLDKVRGLVVTWLSNGGVVKEYVCGSGDPERLNFRRGMPSVPSLYL
ncbi:hypothetical protein CPC08DRAFT_705796 [Agrocybe pediades]|nr:hypothetical protein CPC08DRAFT_705796 [Agrocybe pediades]